MQAQCSLKTIVKVFLCTCMSCMLFGCKQDSPVNAISFGDWLDEIVNQANMITSNETKPYFIHINQSHPKFHTIQTLVEWGVLDQSHPIQLDSLLTKELCAYTLMNLANKHEKNIQSGAKDINQSTYRNEIENAIVSGIMPLDERQLFHPSDIMDQNEAIGLLQTVIAYLDDRPIEENHFSYTVNDDIKQIDIISYDSTSDILETKETITEDTIISFQVDDTVYIKKVDSIQQNEEIQKVYVSDVEEDEVFEDIDLEGQTEINFDDAQIIEDVNPSAFVYQTKRETDHLELVSSQTKNHQFEYKGFQITYRLSGKQAFVNVIKKLPYGSEMYAKFQLNNVQLKYALHRDGYHINDAYMKVHFQSNESFGFDTTIKEKRFADLSKIDKTKFLSSLKQAFSSQDEFFEEVIPICSFRVPLTPDAIATVLMSLQIQISANGKAELVLTQAHDYGFEYRNKGFRIIRDTKSSHKENIKADVKTVLESFFSIQLCAQNMMDLLVDAGAKGSITSKIHIFDEEGRMKSTSLAEPISLVESARSHHPDILACADIKGHWLLDVKLNSAKSTLGKFGLSHTMHLLDEKNASLFPSSSIHIENFHVVPKCTRGNREKPIEVIELKVTKRITLDKYSLICKLGQNSAILITGLPDGYQLDDLLFTSEDTDIVQVNQDGLLIPKEVGNTIVHIQTKDEKHTVDAHILVLNQNEKK